MAPRNVDDLVDRLGLAPLPFERGLFRETWNGARTAAGGDWSLFATTMAPRFVATDYQPGEADALAAAWPGHERLIRALTRSG